MSDSTPATPTALDPIGPAPVLAAALHEYRETLRRDPAGPYGSLASTEPFGAFAVGYLARYGLAVRPATKPVAGIAPAQFISRMHADWSALSAFDPGRPTFGAYLLERLERAGYTLRPSCLEEAPAAAAPPEPELESILGPVGLAELAANEPEPGPLAECMNATHIGEPCGPGCMWAEAKPKPWRGGSTRTWRQAKAAAAAQVNPSDLYPLNVPVPDSPHWHLAVGMSVGEVADLLEALDERGLRWIRGEGGPDAERGRIYDGPAEPPNLSVVFDEFRGAWQRDDDEAGSSQARWFSTAGGEASTWSHLWQRRGPIAPDGGIPAPAAGDDGCGGGVR